MNQITRVLLCDDSSVMRRLIKTALQTDPNVKVIGEAKHGKDACDQAATIKPDVIIMDVEMPVMDGIDAVRTLRKRRMEIPVIMFSSLTSRGAEATLDAIEAGASDFATKPVAAGHIDDAIRHVQNDLIPKVHHWGRRPRRVFNPPATKPPVAAGRAVPTTPAQNRPLQNRSEQKRPARKTGTAAAIAIAVSTGGPHALSRIIGQLPVNLNASVLIAQHMPPVFTGLLAERLAAQKGHQVKEATEGDVVEPGTILIAPGDFHMTVERDSTLVRARLGQGVPENSCRPSADPLFRSVAAVYGRNCLGVVLTGMGSDGVNGAAVLSQTGAKIIAQDKETSVVWGMPGNVVDRGLADRVLPLEQIADELIRATARTAQTPPSCTSA